MPVQLPDFLVDSLCAVDVAAVLEGAEGWLTTREIYDRLEAAQKLHGWSTVKQVLATMSRLHVLESRRRKPYGYRLATAPVTGGGASLASGQAVGAQSPTHPLVEQARAQLAQAVAHVTEARAAPKTADQVQEGLAAVGCLAEAVTGLVDVCEMLGGGPPP